jgi:MFS family permease
MPKLWVLLALDSMADGMVSYSLTNYYMDKKFHPAKSTLGDAQSTAYLLGTIGTVFAGPMARQIGLINTMVFTHIPSSASVLAFPAPSSLWLTIGLLFIRTGFNGMDQAPRAAFIAAVVKPEERTAVMGITSMLRTLASTAGPTITGILAGNDKFWIAFVTAGICRLVYDLGLYAMFVNMPLHLYEARNAPQAQVDNDDDDDNDDDASESVELSFTESEEEDDDSEMETGVLTDPKQATKAWNELNVNDPRRSSSLLPGPDSRVRRRSRSPMPRTSDDYS